MRAGVGFRKKKHAGGNGEDGEEDDDEEDLEGAEPPAPFPTSARGAGARASYVSSWCATSLDAYAPTRTRTRVRSLSLPLSPPLSLSLSLSLSPSFVSATTGAYPDPYASTLTDEHVSCVPLRRHDDRRGPRRARAGRARARLGGDEGPGPPRVLGGNAL